MRLTKCLVACFIESHILLLIPLVVVISFLGLVLEYTQPGSLLSQIFVLLVFANLSSCTAQIAYVYTYFNCPSGVILELVGACF
jgi:hypothetical protein